MTALVVRDFKIPDGWTMEAVEHPSEYSLIQTPQPFGFMVTIHWKRRGFKGGYSTVNGRLDSTERYSGRGWEQRLVDGAVAWLRATIGGDL